MDSKTAKAIIDAPVEIDLEREEEHATYVGFDRSVKGVVTVRATREHIRAELRTDEDPLADAMARTGGEIFANDLMLRNAAPGKLLSERAYARIEPDKGD